MTLKWIDKERLNSLQNNIDNGYDDLFDHEGALVFLLTVSLGAGRIGYFHKPKKQYGDLSKLSYGNALETNPFCSKERSTLLGRQGLVFL